MRIAGRWSAWPALGLLACSVAFASGGSAQSPQPLSPPQFQSNEPAPGTMLPQTPPPARSAPSEGTPGSGPGFIDTFTRWMQESTAGFSIGPRSGTKDSSSDPGGAAGATNDVARGAVEATRGAADAVTSVAKETAGALTRLPTARVAAGRERCGIAPNGAPDCRTAAETLCRAKGFASGSSIDFETAEVCPSSAALARWRGEHVKCTIENYVTRALCQ